MVVKTEKKVVKRIKAKTKEDKTFGLKKHSVYVVCGLSKAQTLNTGQHLPLAWADGMIGVLPVFATRKEAEQYAGEKYEILEFRIPAYSSR